MADEIEAGWGSGPWGDAPWGDGDDVFRALDVLAIRENVIRIEFNQSIFLNGLLDKYDASDPTKWIITNDATTVGIDGIAARPVRAMLVELAEDVPSIDYGRFVDVTLDRPFTPWPASYNITAVGIYNAQKSDVTTGSASLAGLYRFVEVPQIETAIRARDIANPQTLSAAQESLPEPTLAVKLGTYSADDTGDYAIDDGVTSLKKRIIRRVITVPGAFAHLQGYGIGVLQYIRRLATVEVQADLSTRAEEQISQEPEVAKCRVRFVGIPKRPGLYYMQIFVRTRQGLTQRFQVPLGPGIAIAA